MGAWGTGSFENDDALDWVFELCDATTLKPVQAALGDVLEAASDALLEAPVCSTALAAAEVVAAAIGAPLRDLPEDVRGWLAARRPTAGPDLVDRARRAVARIEAASELKDLWDDAGPSAAEWYDAVRDLRARLSSSPSPGQ